MKKKIIKRIILIIILSIIALLFRPTYTPSIDGDKSISKLVNIKVCGQNQTLLIRGKNKENPIILFLHGGPGLAQICYARKYQSKLEDDFLVVNWDQRGSGKSYSFFMNKDNFTKNQLAKDAREIIDYLCKNYGKDKIILVGHSWGTELGMNIIKNDSSKILAYIGVGQVVNNTEGECISYEHAIDLAKQNQDNSALNILEDIGNPPYKDVIKATLEKENIIKKYCPLEKDINVTKDVVEGCLFSPESNWLDAIKYICGNKLSAEKLWGTNKDFNLFNDVKKVDIPIYFCAGRYDYTTPSVLVEKYYKMLQAPYKEFIWFENSAHYPQYTESDKFHNLLLDILKTRGDII
ncbi:alpha/beta fold hydrolase [Clostridium weizhouense]|uniref:Alpha/beta hydrolase n=1 Tax=Clostridium weizhouense TaxID=2859781 RepID=A0ABS7AR95_9CLOT|nr:alpha/beta hydrolase [Clostridium weizhouense]MBW6411188.1 alpha/beta hydrolase [Clostridium weizhouense]